MFSLSHRVFFSNSSLSSLKKKDGEIFLRTNTKMNRMYVRLPECSEEVLIFLGCFVCVFCFPYL